MRSGLTNESFIRYPTHALDSTKLLQCSPWMSYSLETIKFLTASYLVISHREIFYCAWRFLTNCVSINGSCPHCVFAWETKKLGISTVNWPSFFKKNVIRCTGRNLGVILRDSFSHFQPVMQQWKVIDAFFSWRPSGLLWKFEVASTITFSSVSLLRMGYIKKNSEPRWVSWF